ncbi:beta-1,3-galactosyltransferase 5-like [Apostichopus japonicus]|uniref:beta-1,3-galactosyltransferase 5-like n=1 Tax=Stichopus japonicus TaxID=307972 RepID=UPI003AB386B8
MKTKITRTALLLLFVCSCLVISEILYNRTFTSTLSLRDEKSDDGKEIRQDYSHQILQNTSLTQSIPVLRKNGFDCSSDHRNSSNGNLTMEKLSHLQHRQITIEPQEIMNPHDFKMLQNEPDICRRQVSGGDSREVFLLILRLSKPSDFKRRQTHREILNAYTTNEQQEQQIVKQLFLIGKTFNETTISDIKKEIDNYHDILQEDFVDSYRNLTLKTIMGIKWASIYCPEASWVVKADDDVYINFGHMIAYLEFIGNAKKVIIGNIVNGSLPIRRPKSKWYVSREEYPSDKYPNYVNGPCYVISGCLTPWLYRESLTVPFLSMEDVFIGVLAERLRIPLINNRLFIPRLLYFEFELFYVAIMVHLINPDKLQDDFENYQKLLQKYLTNSTEEYSKQ